MMYFSPRYHCAAIALGILAVVLCVTPYAAHAQDSGPGESLSDESMSEDTVSEVAEPGSTDPGNSDLGNSDLGNSDLGNSDPGTSEPDGESNATEGNATEGNATESGSTEANATEANTDLTNGTASNELGTEAEGNTKESDPTDSTKAEAKTPTAPKVSTRPRKLEREQPTVDVKQQLVAKNKLEVEATVKGSGPVKVIGTLSWRPNVSDLLRTDNFTARVTLDDCGGSSLVKRTFIIPPSAAEWRSNVTAENTGDYRGCPDLKGCCPAEGKAGAKARCESDGAVRCADGTTSSSCKCGT